MRAIVTGGAGFIGSNLVDALLERGDEVIVVDNLSTGNEGNLLGALERGAVLLRLDIGEGDALAELVARERPHAIFHLAAQIDVRRSVSEPGFDARVNVEGTVNVLEAAHRAGVARVVNTSTGGAIYGDVDTIPTPETQPPAPMAGYGTSKFCAEQYCGLYQRLHGLSTVTLRLGNVFGPRQDPLGEAGVIAIFCGKLKDGGSAVIYGDGTQTRDYTYVGDVVRAQLLAADRGDIHGSINVGTGRETTILELAQALREHAGRRDFTPEHAPPRLGELHRSCLDVTRARELLGFEAQVDVSEGIRLTLASGLA
jgi:UDP-glucose 4-epimerase